MMNKCTATNEAVWRKRRCSPAETAVQIFKFASRPCRSEPPPASSRFDVGSKCNETRANNFELTKRNDEQYFLFFPHLTFFKTNFSRHTNGTFGLPKRTKPTLRKQKEPFFAYAPEKDLDISIKMRMKNQYFFYLCKLKISIIELIL
jgi:hypothetical protein